MRVTDIIQPTFSSRTSFFQSISAQLGDRLINVIDTHNTSSVLFIFRHLNKQFVLKAEFGKQTATHNEISWYEHGAASVAKHDKPLVNIPYIDAYSNSSFALLLLRFIENSHTLDALIASGHALSPHILTRAWEFNSHLFSLTARGGQKNLVGRMLSEKYNARRIEAKKYAYLDKLLERPSVLINGQSFLTPNYVLKYIAENTNYYNFLTPDKVGMIHGDLHCSNILSDGITTSLIDPKGAIDLPLEYDVGKLLHSLHGRYDYIMQERYQLETLTPTSFSFEITPNDLLDHAVEALKSKLSSKQYIRGVYFEAHHFATMLSHHASNQGETTALFLRSVQIFDELLCILQKELEK